MMKEAKPKTYNILFIDMFGRKRTKVKQDEEKHYKVITTCYLHDNGEDWLLYSY